MAVEKKTVTIVKRTLWVSECPKCESRMERTSNPPKERRCNSCRTWVPYEKVEYESREYGQQG